MIGIASNVIVTVFNSDGLIGGIGSFVGGVTEFLASFFVCTGVINLAERLGNNEVYSKGKSIRTFLMIAFLITGILSLAPAVFGGSTGMKTVLTIIDIVSSLICVAAYAVYLILMNKANKMLE